MIWANRGLPVFMATVSGRKPGSLPESPFDVDIDTTLHRVRYRIRAGFPVHGLRFNR
ncbi:MAG: hypothetical protein CAPSK01_001136 [Candidatus Accumulibacter vicinus]|uniref:Uncharacterized protein n=1 Tax=Candidatus Accumulibacter vicinus TaxID=2954382 RepID=A0A084Y2K3_9PROT|nr:MAG: hypothetical protein CAPSK01_001136 [Candidatus Accumulibacter vicinus]